MSPTMSTEILAKRALDSALMPPPPPPKRIKRPAKVIDEDTYTEAISHIIARDFFPGLVEVESKQDYLDALDSQDQEWIASAGRTLTEVLTPGPNGRKYRGRRGTGMTPMAGFFGQVRETPRTWQGDTPMSVISSVTSIDTSSLTEKPDVDTNLSLGAFQAKYTSEDNESFYKLLDKQNLKKAEKYSWLWSGNQIASQRQIAHRTRETAIQANKAAQEAIDDGKPLLSIEPPDDRKATPDAWPVNPENSLMFSPRTLSDSELTVQQTAEATSRAPPKAVIYDNTRFAPASAQSSSSLSDPPPSPSLSAIQDAIAGHPRPTASEVSFSQSPSTPRVNGYSFVDSTPSPSPSDLSSNWGGSDPLSLLGAAEGGSTPNPFSIKDKSKREALHHRMVDKVARAKRVSKREAELRTPVPRFASSPRVATRGLTPAGQRLLGRVGAGTGTGTGAGIAMHAGSSPGGSAYGWSGIKRNILGAAEGNRKSKLS